MSDRFKGQKKRVHWCASPGCQFSIPLKYTWCFRHENVDNTHLNRESKLQLQEPPPTPPVSFASYKLRDPGALHKGTTWVVTARYTVRTKDGLLKCVRVRESRTSKVEHMTEDVFDKLFDRTE